MSTMVGFFFVKLADLLDADAKEREDTARILAAEALRRQPMLGTVVTDVMPALTVAATLRAIAAALRKVGAS